ncbi:MAG: diguanylate cyclase [Thermoanaerobacteraceae bacterium]|nr:diguanylate cyclase [Thermoanaerobacteraceae bacterium]
MIDNRPGTIEQQFKERSRSLELRRRLILLLLSLVFLTFVSFNTDRKVAVISVTTFLALFYLVYLYIFLRFFEKKYQVIWWAGFLLDLAVVGFLISVCGRIASPFVLLYPLVMIGAAAICPKERDFIIAGSLGHVSYAWAVYSFTGNFSFYLDANFWIICVLNGIIFLSTVQVIQLLTSDKDKLYYLTRDLERKNKRLEQVAVTDGLTGLYNHKYFWERIAEEFERTQRAGRSITVLMIDIDYFKFYNDKMGHLKGDELLRQLSEIFNENVRRGDIVCRYGGEEFAIILPETDEEEGLKIAERLRNVVAEYPFEGREHMPNQQVTVSIGMASYPKDAADAKELVKRADSALYCAKQKNKNSVQTYYSVLEDMKNSGADQERLFKTMEVMVSIINAKDSYTGGHSQRVVRYARALGKRLGLNEGRLRALLYAAFLHDIGKIEIDKKILNKPGPLTEKERKEIKKHTLYGVNIVEPVLTSEVIIPAIKYHHEHFDGSGYPEGLKGDQIPLEARILCLVDSFDAMRANRPYRDALSLEEAIGELKINAGRQFDPKLVSKFLEVIKLEKAMN